MTLECEGNTVECAFALLLVNAIIIATLETLYACFSNKSYIVPTR